MPNPFPKKILANLKAILIVLVIATAVFSSATYILYQDTQQKAGVIRVQTADIANKSQVIQNQGDKIGALDIVVTNQTSVIQNQTGKITKLNFTVFDQNDTIQRQIFELRRRADQIDTLEGNVSKLKVDLQNQQNEIVSLTPVSRNYFVAAVKGDGGGAIIPIVIKVVPKGTGLLAVNIKNVELQSGAQESIRLAAAVASKLSNIGLSDKDIDISFVNELADLVSVDGPSAGGAITVAIYATLKQQSISSSTLMTGTIQADTTIGQVGGVDKKAQAARTQGASRFLVPKGQSVTVSGLEVKEINTVQDAITNVVG